MSDVIVRGTQVVVSGTLRGADGAPGSLITSTGAVLIQDANSVIWKVTISVDGWLQSNLASTTDINLFNAFVGTLI